ncbi:MAG: phosphatidate cytidylyltransferase [Mucinivorans sp.]
MNNIWKRTLSGVLLAVVVLWATDRSPLTFSVLWIVIFGGCLWEYLYLVRRFGSVFGRGKVMSQIIGTLYIALPTVLILTFNGSEYLRMTIITFLTLVWANDVGGYLVGSNFGRHKMIPSISPKKTWEGFFGGIIFAIAVGLLWNLFFWEKVDLIGFTTINTWIYFGGMGLVAALGAVAGDLVESKFKRVLGIKDSGSVIPGHGGMLDRFDAMMIATPAMWLYMYLYFQ